jgi:hypothetical protein
MTLPEPARAAALQVDALLRLERVGVRCERCNTHWHPRASALLPLAGTTCPRCRQRPAATSRARSA